ncbi:MAG: YigZ family protein [Acholeplasmatales bacterium]|jgi:putative IMPACT (imprinted ancient) family translation regulator|nr:YigZ family protein [Acholeplasmatales bacterium]
MVEPTFYLQEKANYEYYCRKSRFLAYGFYLNNLTQIMDYISSLKAQHHQAAHFPYAYIFHEQIFASDNGEPAHSAAENILSALKSSHFNNILVVVVRYFGGLKLGLPTLGKCFYWTTQQMLQGAIKYQLKEIFTYQLRVTSIMSASLYKYLNQNNIKIKSTVWDDDLIIEVENIDLEAITPLVKEAKLLSRTNEFTKLES